MFFSVLSNASDFVTDICLADDLISQGKCHLRYPKKNLTASKNVTSFFDLFPPLASENVTCRQCKRPRRTNGVLAFCVA